MVEHVVESRIVIWTQVSEIPKSMYIRLNQIALAIFKAKQILRTSFKLVWNLSESLHTLNDCQSISIFM